MNILANLKQLLRRQESSNKEESTRSASRTNLPIVLDRPYGDLSDEQIKQQYRAVIQELREQEPSDINDTAVFDHGFELHQEWALRRGSSDDLLSDR